MASLRFEMEMGVRIVMRSRSVDLVSHDHLAVSFSQRWLKILQCSCHQSLHVIDVHHNSATLILVPASRFRAWAVPVPSST